jgi:hypothetical protein
MYVLTFKDSVWYINGTKLILPRDQQDDAVSLLAGLADDGTVLPGAIDPTTHALLVKVLGSVVASDVTVINDISNPVPVYNVGSIGVGFCIFDTKELLADAEDVVVSYTAIADCFILKAECTGQSDGLWTLLRNGIIIQQGRSGASNLNYSFNMDGNVKVSAGQTIEIKVKNTYKVTADYAATLIIK